MKKTIGILSAIVFASTISSAELVGSLLLNTNDDTNNVDRLTGFRTRTGNGNENTRGTVQGTFSLRGSVDLGTGGYTGADVSTFSGNTKVKELNRYGGNAAGGIAVWDYDLDGMVTNAWEFKVDYDSRRGNCLAGKWYVSFNGFGRSLDTTVITNIPAGSAASLVSDLTKFVEIGELPADTAAGTFAWDLTDIVNAAATNGGGIRLVYWDNTYLDTGPAFLNNSGLSAGNSTTGTTVKLENFYLADTFDSASGDVPLNGWTESGPEPKEYNNPTNGPGILNLRDLDNDERETGASEHAGFWDTLTYELENGIALSETDDWVQLQLDLGIYLDMSGANLKDGRNVRVSLVDSSETNNAGFGFMLQTGTNSLWSNFHEFDAPGGYINPALDGANCSHPFDGSLSPLSMKITKADGGYDIDAFWCGVAFDIPTVSNSLASTFDTLTITVSAIDMGLKVDNAYIISNVDPIILTPFEEWAELYGLTEGNDGPGDNPDLDELNNWSEYVFGGNPMDGADIGTQPSMDSSGYVYTLRNDTVLTAYILTRDDLMTGDWATNAADPVVVDDGGLSAYTNTVGTGEIKQFYKLIVE